MSPTFIEVLLEKDAKLPAKLLHVNPQWRKAMSNIVCFDVWQATLQDELSIMQRTELYDLEENGKIITYREHIVCEVYEIKELTKV